MSTPTFAPASTFDDRSDSRFDSRFDRRFESELDSDFGDGFRGNSWTVPIPPSSLSAARCRPRRG